MHAMSWVRTILLEKLPLFINLISLGRRLQVTVWQRAGKFEKNQCIGEGIHST